MYPTDLATAKAWVSVLTRDCDRLRRQIPALTGKRLTVAIAQFREVNETRVTVIERWGLQRFAARLVRGGE